jgi:hypothetical protein
MEINQLLIELYGRIPHHVRAAVDGLDADALTTAPVAGANPIGWIVWHLTRVQDDHVAELMDKDQVWVTGDWTPRFGVPPTPTTPATATAPTTWPRYGRTAPTC